MKLRKSDSESAAIAGNLGFKGKTSCRNRGSLGRRTALLAQMAAALVLVSTAAAAATITVNTLLDPSGTSGTCSLRDAITAANTMTAIHGCAAGTGTDVIGFSVVGTIILGSELPTITGNLNITGPTDPPGVTIDGNSSVPVMQVSSSANLTLDKLTIAHGASFDCVCDEFDICSGPGGILNNGVLTVTRSTFSGNNTVCNGGGIENQGTLTVTDSAFSGNTAFGGGGITTDGLGNTLTVTNSTFSGNDSCGGGGILARSVTTVINSTFSDNRACGAGGGIFSGGRLTVTNSTFSGNIGGIEGGGTIAIAAGIATVKGTIFAGFRNCDRFFGGQIIDAGYNISENGSCPGVAVDPKLDPAGLRDNGGPTQTIALQQDSPAIDAIPIAECTDQATAPNPIVTDQRGMPRPDFGEAFCDIGAYESQETFAGQPGMANCQGQSVSTLSNQFGTLSAAASALGFSSVSALQTAIRTFCGG